MIVNRKLSARHQKSIHDLWVRPGDLENDDLRFTSPCATLGPLHPDNEIITHS